MRKIALVSEHASPLAQPGSVDSGGQNIYVAQVARQLASRGYHVDVFTRQDTPYLPVEIDWKENIRVVHVPAGPAEHLPKESLLSFMPDFSAFLQTYFAAQREPYDILHANFFMSAMAALPVARRTGIPLVVTFHALGKVRRQFQASADLFPDARFTIEDEIVRNADCIIAECPQDERDLIELYHADPGRIRMVPCGFDAEEMVALDQSVARNVLGWDPSTFYILQLGRLVPRKGVDNVIRGLALLRRHHGVDARLSVVGGNSIEPCDDPMPELARLKEVARAEGVLDYVEFAGRRGRDVLHRYYSAADVFVTTPWYEPFGITPVEAMACGRPVVGSDTGGIKYTVVDGECGFLVAPRDPKALAARLALLARNPTLARRMGHAGRNRANALFTWQGVGAQLESIFRELCQSTDLPFHAQGGSAGAQLMA